MRPAYVASPLLPGKRGSRLTLRPPTKFATGSKEFDVCDDRRSADIHVSLRGSAPSFLQGRISIRRKSKPSLAQFAGTRRRRSTRWHEVAGSARPGAAGSRNGYIMQVVANPRGGFM